MTGQPIRPVPRRQFGPLASTALWALRVIVILLIALTIFVFIRNL